MINDTDAQMKRSNISLCECIAGMQKTLSPFNALSILTLQTLKQKAEGEKIKPNEKKIPNNIIVKN
jgi:hypothetical protein